jgi:hypothetical protein
MLYAIQFVTCLRRHHHFRQTVEEYPEYCDEVNPGKGSYFLFVAFFLPFGISAISVLASFLRPSGGELAPHPIWAAAFWGMANVVFVLMITLMISYLYDRSTPDWTTALTASLVLDILAYLVFVLVFNDPQRWPADAAPRWYHMLLLGLVGAASFITSFTTIYYTRSFDKFVVKRGDKGVVRRPLPPKTKPTNNKQALSAAVTTATAEAMAPSGRSTPRTGVD